MYVNEPKYGTNIRLLLQRYSIHSEETLSDIKAEMFRMYMNEYKICMIMLTYVVTVYVGFRPLTH